MQSDWMKTISKGAITGGISWALLKYVLGESSSTISLAGIDMDSNIALGVSFGASSMASEKIKDLIVQNLPASALGNQNLISAIQPLTTAAVGLGVFGIASDSELVDMSMSRLDLWALEVKLAVNGPNQN